MQDSKRIYAPRTGAGQAALAVEAGHRRVSNPGPVEGPGVMIDPERTPLDLARDHESAMYDAMTNVEGPNTDFLVDVLPEPTVVRYRLTAWLRVLFLRAPFFAPLVVLGVIGRWADKTALRIDDEWWRTRGLSEDDQCIEG